MWKSFEYYGAIINIKKKKPDCHCKILAALGHIVMFIIIL